VPGANADNPELVMTCLLDHYPREIQDAFLQQYAESGYTHLQRSYGHAMANDGWPGTSLEDFIALSARAKRQYGLFIDQLCDAFVRAGVCDTACVGWQLDQLFGAVPGNTTIAVIAYIADKLPQSVPLYTHWMNEALAWWADKGEQWTDRYGSSWVANRFDWWRVMQPYLTGGHHQGDTQIAKRDPKLYQDKLKDTLDPFGGETSKGNMGRSQRGGDRPFLLTVFECSAQDQFNGVTTEDEGDLVGYLLMCTTGWHGAHLGGYGNGARMPDGTAL
jgi:hypothetical protein